MGGPTGALTTISCWLKGVYMCQDDTCEIISQSDHPFNNYDQKSKCSIYVSHWMRHIRYHVKILAASDRNPITQYTALGCYHSTCTGENRACITGLQEEINIKGHVRNPSSTLNFFYLGIEVE